MAVGWQTRRTRFSLELEEVIFGIRCKSTVKFTIVQALANRGRSVQFFEMREVSGTFRLRKYALDTDELAASLPRRSRSILEAFEDLTNNDNSFMENPV